MKHTCWDPYTTRDRVTIFTPANKSSKSRSERMQIANVYKLDSSTKYVKLKSKRCSNYQTLKLEAEKNIEMEDRRSNYPDEIGRVETKNKREI